MRFKTKQRNLKTYTPHQNNNLHEHSQYGYRIPFYDQKPNTRKEEIRQERQLQQLEINDGDE